LPAELASREFFLETVAQVDIRPLLDHLVLQEEGSYLLSKASHLPQKPFIGGLTCRHINRIRRLVDHVLIDSPEAGDGLLAERAAASGPTWA